MPEQVHCALCASRRTRLLVKKRLYALVRCRGCGFVYTSPRATPDEQKGLYEQEYLANLERNKNILIATAEERLAFVERYKQRGKLLDFGCGMGYFLDCAHKNGWDVTGIEYSEHALDYCRARYPFTVLPAIEPSSIASNGSFDCITLWHVIEHLRDPVKILTQLRPLLAPGGILVAEVPNNNFIFEHVRPWRLKSYSEMCEHLAYFTPKTFSLLFKRAAYTVQVITWGHLKSIRTCFREKIIRSFARIGLVLSALTNRNWADTVRTVVCSDTTPSVDAVSPETKTAVAHITGSSEWAGGEVYLKGVVQYLDKQRYELHVICPEAGVLIRKLREYGQHAEVIDMSRLFRLRSVFQLAAYIKRHNIALIQSHGARSNFYARLVKLLVPKVTVVSTVHNSLFDYPVSFTRKAAYLLADRVTYPLANGILTVSESLATDLIDRLKYSPYRITTIYNGIKLDAFDVLIEKGISIRNEFKIGHAPLIGLVGRMTPQKGHRYILEAMPEILQRFPDVRLLFAGDGPERRALAVHACQLGVEQACIFAGVRDDIPAVFAALDGVVVPSVSEGFPYVVLEAMAMARPIVASAVNGIPEMVADEQTALLVEPRDVPMLAKAVVRMLQNRAGSELMGRRARERVRERYSIEMMIRTLERYYARVMN